MSGKGRDGRSSFRRPSEMLHKWRCVCWLLPEALKHRDRSWWSCSVFIIPNQSSFIVCPWTLSLCPFVANKYIHMLIPINIYKMHLAYETVSPSVKQISKSRLRDWSNETDLQVSPTRLSPSARQISKWERNKTLHSNPAELNFVKVIVISKYLIHHQANYDFLIMNKYRESVRSYLINVEIPFFPQPMLTLRNSQLFKLCFQGLSHPFFYSHLSSSQMSLMLHCTCFLHARERKKKTRNSH